MKVCMSQVLAGSLLLPAARAFRSNIGNLRNRLSAPFTSSTARMCGLIAVVNDVWSDSQDADSTHELLQQPSLLEECTRILHHRGPDGYQVLTDQEGFSMGHTRLAIVDPDNRQADMPFTLDYGNTKIHLVANGEIYNHEDIYRQIQEKGWDSSHRVSQSDCEVIGHAYQTIGGPATIALLDGMFAFTLVEQDAQTGEIRNLVAARDSVGIKPLYYGSKDGSYVFSSELKGLVGHVDPSSVVAIPAGHSWTPQKGLERFYKPSWLMQDDYAPWKESEPTDDDIRQAFTKAVQKRMMADVEYGFFLSGGIDSCVVAHDLLPLYRAEREKRGDFRPIHTYTVGMQNSPDVMAAKAMVEALGGSDYIDHHIREFTPDEVFDLIPKIIYHMETYEAELIRSSIPNWLLAERAAQDVKMVLTGEGSDEVFAGYLYFSEAGSAGEVQNELKRIYGMLGNINLHRTDRMTMAHGLEARVPFLDTNFTKLVMSVDPSRKMVDADAVRANSRGREKTLLRELFEEPNANGDSIPRPVLWRAKAMQCEGVGEDWVSILQNRIASLVSDEDMANAATKYALNTPQTKEELYYRQIFDEHYEGMEHVITPWEGGGRAMGAAWKTDMYTREGLKNVNLLSHSLQNANKVSKENANGDSGKAAVDGSANRAVTGSVDNAGDGKVSNAGNGVVDGAIDGKVGSSQAVKACQDACERAESCGYSKFEALLTSGGDCRSLIDPKTRKNKYHIRPQPVEGASVFRGSCTGNPPSDRGYKAARSLYENVFDGLSPEETEIATRNIFEQQRERLFNVLDLPEGSEIILCPSGSDAEYIPIAIAKALNPNANVTNGSTQLKETGAGTTPASRGQFFSEYAPLMGQVDRSHLEGFETIDGEAIPARNRDGSVVDAKAAMDKFYDDAIANGQYPIVHSVFGGKTGIRDEIVARTLDAGAKALGVVDACQMRLANSELHGWLAEDSLVLVTASKFYQAPPFCGAIIIPPAVARKLRQAPSIPTEMFGADGLGGFLTEKEIPDSLKHWREGLTSNGSNVGLALRWQAGLAGMEAALPISDEKREDLVEEWATTVADMVDEEESLDAWCVERSIVSIRVANGSGGWLDMAELRVLFRWMSMDVSHLIPDASFTERIALSTPCFIGQPVDVSDSHGIVRIALGVESMISYNEDPRSTISDDAVVVQKLAAIGKYFKRLRRAESEFIAPTPFNRTAAV